MSQSKETKYTVKRGDTLKSIALENNLTVEAILNANPDIADPEDLRSGQSIVLPLLNTSGYSSGDYYTVKVGDTLESIAKEHGTAVDAILLKNPKLIDTDSVEAGETIEIPKAHASQIPPPPATCSGRYYTVVAGDSLYLIAQRNNITLDALLAANPQITDPARISVGQVICVPGTTPSCEGTLYTIRAGDTLFSLAQRYNTTVDAIIRANPGIDPNNLRIGQVICIPSSTPGPVPCPGGTLYTIRAGDTLFALAQRYNTTVDAILRANPGIDPNNLRVGQIICIPGTGPVPCPGGTLYTIRAGDTLFSLAQRFNVTVDAIIQANPGIDPNNLRVGQVICIPGTGPVPCPGGTLYTIRAGDTLFSLAQRFNVTVDAVLRANPGIDPNNLRIGQEICIPAATLEIESRMECPGTIYTIRQGDSLYQLAIRYNTTVDRIMRFNPGIDPNNLQIGQRICIPTGTHDVSGKRCQVLMRTSSAPRAEGFGIYDFDCNNVSALAIDLPDPEGCGGRVYKMFVRERNTHHWHSATMYASPDGIWVGIVRLPRTLDMYDLVQISAESRESTSPIGVVVLRGDISKA